MKIKGVDKDTAGEK